ncbi:hypothetical protein ACJ2_13160 [Pantoea sp. QMID2]|nr:hypothetical protein ACJ2_13160 [Pantoea sp. QMID2]
MKTSKFVHKKILRIANHTAIHQLIELARNLVSRVTDTDAPTEGRRITHRPAGAK